MIHSFFVLQKQRQKQNLLAKDEKHEITLEIHDLPLKNIMAPVPYTAIIIAFQHQPGVKHFNDKKEEFLSSSPVAQPSRAQDEKWS